jgi:hypothetical protein
VSLAVKRVNETHELAFNRISAFAEEIYGEPVRPRSFILWHQFYSASDLLLREVNIKGG